MTTFPPQSQVRTVVADPASVDAAIGSRFSPNTGPHKKHRKDLGFEGGSLCVRSAVKVLFFRTVLEKYRLGTLCVSSI